MKKELVTIIIPVYKVEQYLDKCVESVVNQTYKNLEIILVDDGSPDNCPAMCDEWAKKDSRIKVIHKKNGGLSDARNAGLNEMAKNGYVIFLDSDDYLSPTTCEDLLGLVKKYEADVAICNFARVNEDGKIENVNNENVVTIFEGNDRFDLLNIYPVQTIVAWGKIYKKDIFNDIRYPVGKIYEDGYVVHQYLYEAKRVVYSSKQLWFYLQRQDSIMGENKGKYKKEDNDAFLMRIEFFKANKVDEEIITTAYVAYLRALLGSLIKENVAKADRQYINNEFKEKYKEVSWKYVSFKKKIILFFYRYFKINLIKLFGK